MHTVRSAQADRISTLALAAGLLLLGSVGCQTGSVEPIDREEIRRSLVCVTAGPGVAAPDTIPTMPDGSCPVGFDVMTWV